MKLNVESLQQKRPPLNPARVLILIRDRKVKTVEDLIRYFSTRKSTRTEFLLEVEALNATVDELVRAGFVRRSKRDVLTPTALIERVQTALGISLSQLSTITPQSMHVCPVFGNPQPRRRADVFVLMPFSDRLAPVYSHHMRAVARKLRLTIARADDFFTVDAVIADIWASILRSRIVIADCTTKNANVFYEIGIAHTIGRPTVLLAQNLDDIPFDLRHLRCIIYTQTPDGMAKFETALESTLLTLRSTLRQNKAARFG